MTKENTEKDYIWYASYGSNLNKDRFLVYILGGTVAGNATEYPGCRDTTLPIREKAIIIHHDLYFAKESPSWQRAGVAFISNVKSLTSKTYGYMYLIKTEQFCDIVQQEIKSIENLTIDFNAAIENESVIFKNGSWYGAMLFLETIDNYPVFTFTHQLDLANKNAPSAEYLTMIIKGLNQSHQLDNQAIVSYLISKPGVNGAYTQEELAKITEMSLTDNVNTEGNNG